MAAAAAPLVAAGPAGWVALGILGLGVGALAAVEIMKANQDADETFPDEEPTGVESCSEDSCAGAQTSPADTEGKYKDLPKNPDDLFDEGYEETTHPNARKQGTRNFHNPKTGDEIEFHKGRPNETGRKAKDHWHRHNPNKTGKRDAMLDKNGNPVPEHSKPSHIPPTR